MNDDVKRLSGQAHVVSHADSSPFLPGGLRSCFEYRHFGVKDATNGKYEAFVQRALPGGERDDGWHYHELDFHLLYILSGWITFEYEDTGITTLRAGSCVLQPSGLRHRAIKHSDDFQMLESDSNRVCNAISMVQLTRRAFDEGSRRGQTARHELDAGNI